MFWFKIFIVYSMVSIFLTLFFIGVGTMYDFNPPKWIEKVINILSVMTLFICVVWFVLIIHGVSVALFS